MWPLRKKQLSKITANSVIFENEIAIIDVRGQTCPGYLLSINKAVESLEPDTSARLLITYPPCGEDVKAWAKARNIEYQGIEQEMACGLSTSENDPLSRNWHNQYSLILSRLAACNNSP